MVLSDPPDLRQLSTGELFDLLTALQGNDQPKAMLSVVRQRFALMHRHATQMILLLSSMGKVLRASEQQALCHALELLTEELNESRGL